MIGGGLASVPGKQLVETTDRMVGDAGEDVGQPGLRVDVVQLGRDDEALEDGSALAVAVGAGEQPCLSAERDATQGSLGGIVAEAMRPSSRKQAKACQCFSMWSMATATSE